MSAATKALQYEVTYKGKDCGGRFFCSTFQEADHYARERCATEYRVLVNGSTVLFATRPDCRYNFVKALGGAL